MTRSFFGIYSIRPGPDNSRLLVHGTTVHGVQNLGSPERERMATTYYVPLSGVGLAMDGDAEQLFGPGARIGIVGLGTGTLACYARPGEQWTFYEIDPAVVRIARDPQRFTFLSSCKPGRPIKVGDARLLIEGEPPATTDLLVVDAFSSDAVPMHLLTREAFADYRRLLSPSGLLLVHISNRYLDLMPVVAAAAADGIGRRGCAPIGPIARTCASTNMARTGSRCRNRRRRWTSWCEAGPASGKRFRRGPASGRGPTTMRASCR